MMKMITGDTLPILLVGSTHYVDIGKETEAIIYYASETVAHMTLPDGPTFKGTLDIGNDGYSTNWEGGPKGNWQIGYEPGKFTYFGPDGKAGGTVTKIVPGNPANF
ncbi:MAG: hypothetical protein ACTSX7_17655 [Alphaproteobacteria bacterium]